MSSFKFYRIKPLVCALQLLSVAPFVLFSAQSMARVINGEELEISAQTPLDNYSLINGATLNAVGANTQNIKIISSTLNLTSSDVKGGGENGVYLLGDAAHANITGSSISSDRTGLVLSFDAISGLASTADVIGGTITGVRNGVSVSALSILTLTGSTLTGTGANAAGLAVFNGTVNASDTNITGGRTAFGLITTPLQTRIVLWI